ncbi:TraR/DksA family transcriptional regulator [Streptomyces sp. SID2888]|uniref:TraR/DksA C4-type zinc finger protein n=1 Tax=Streptomyces sp. SID2888 TaxID=2690256 RepID=UPI0019272495
MKSSAQGTVAEEAGAGRSRKGAGKKAPGGEIAAGEVSPREAVAKKAAGKKSPAGKAAGGGKPASAEAAAGPSGAAKGGTTRSTLTQRAAGMRPAEKAGARRAAKKTGATTVVAKKTPGTATAAKDSGTVPQTRLVATGPGELAVRPGETPWTPEEVSEARAELQSEATRLRGEIDASEQALVGLMRDSGDGAGDDQADTGTKNITREHEMALAANAREMLEQTERALGRLDAGTYGLCESCGNPIGKARMQAFPRATLCVECKQKQERRQ